MDIEEHSRNGIKIIEVIPENRMILTVDEGLDLLGNIYYQGFDRVILHEHTITPMFFDLKTGIAGEILQKFSNYRVRLAIVGDFTKYQGKSIRDFIYESNKKKQINFVSSKEEALEILSHT